MTVAKVEKRAIKTRFVEELQCWLRLHCAWEWEVGVVWLPHTVAPSKVVWMIWGFLEVELRGYQHQVRDFPGYGRGCLVELLGVL